MKAFNTDIGNDIIPYWDADSGAGRMLIAYTSDGKPITQKPDLIERIRNFKINGEKIFTVGIIVPLEPSES